MTRPGETAPGIRLVRAGETFDLAPGETVDVVTDLHDGLGTRIVVRIDGGHGGMKGARVG